MAQSTEKSPETVETSVPKAKAKTRGRASTRIPTPEKYDMSRAEGPDARDGRAQGYPCWGNHVSMPEGRGSLSGRNAHGMWKVCSKCRLRIQYVPAYGATGAHRQAGPLAPDAATALERVGKTIENDVKARENLNSKMASTIGAEESLKNKLKKLEADRLKATSSAPVQPKASADQTQVVTETSKKAAKRENATTAEEAEAKPSEWIEVKSD